MQIQQARIGTTGDLMAYKGGSWWRNEILQCVSLILVDKFSREFDGSLVFQILLEGALAQNSLENFVTSTN